MCLERRVRCELDYRLQSRLRAGRGRGPIPGRRQSHPGDAPGPRHAQWRRGSGQSNRRAVSRRDFPDIAIDWSRRRWRSCSGDSSRRVHVDRIDERAVADSVVRRDWHGQWHREFPGQRQHRSGAARRAHDRRPDICCDAERAQCAAVQLRDSNVFSEPAGGGRPNRGQYSGGCDMFVDCRKQRRMASRDRCRCGHRQWQRDDHCVSEHRRSAHRHRHDRRPHIYGESGRFVRGVAESHECDGGGCGGCGPIHRRDHRAGLRVDRLHGRFLAQHYSGSEWQWQRSRRVFGHRKHG